MKLRILLLAIVQILFGALVFAQNDFTSTPNLGLKLPKVGSSNFGVYVNGDFTTLDAAVGQFHGGFVAVPFSATPIFPLTQGNTFQLTLTGNVTSSTVLQPSITSGQFLYLIICQDATGGRTFTFPTSFQAALPTISTLPNQCSASTWVWSTSKNQWINTGGSGGGSGSPSVGSVGILQASNGAGIFQTTGLRDDGVTNLFVSRDTHFLGPNPSFDTKMYGSYTSAFSPPSATGNITSGLPNLTLSAAQDFANGQGIVVYGAGGLPDISTPGTPTISNIGITGGATTYNYKVIAEEVAAGHDGALTAASSAGTTTTGQTTLGVNTITLTSCSRTNGLTTFTSFLTHNLQTGIEINVSGFGDANSKCNGTFRINTTPLATTFTVKQEGIRDVVDTTGSPLVSVLACNRLTYSASSYSGDATIRYYIYRSIGAGAYSLQGIAIGRDPWYQDCGQGIGTVPSYVPSTPPVATQAGYLASTIVSGGGTTALVLADNAIASASSQVVLHDNSPNVMAALNAACAINGGDVYLSKDTSVTNSSMVFNSVLDTRRVSCSSGQNWLHLIANSAMALNQPLILKSNLKIEGTTNQGGTSFGYNNASLIYGNAYPLIYANTPLTAALLQNLKLSASGAQRDQVAVYVDEDTTGQSPTGVSLYDVNVTRGSNPTYMSPIVIKGGFHFNMQGGSCATGLASWANVYCIDFRNSSAAVTGANNAQIAGLISISNSEIPITFAGAGFRFTDEANSLESGCCSFDAVALYESGLEPFMANYASYAMSDSSVFGRMSVNRADFSTGAATPLAELGGYPNLEIYNTVADQPITSGAGIASFLKVSGIGLAGTAPGTSTHPYISTFTPSSYPGIERTSAMRRMLLNGASIGYSLFAPAITTGPTAGAGGSVPTGNICYAVSVKDINGNESQPGTGSCLTISGGNQTVTFAAIKPAGAVSCTAYRMVNVSPSQNFTSPHPGNQISVGATNSTCSFSDASAVTASPGQQNADYAGASNIGPNGIDTSTFNLLGSNGFSVTLTNAVTAARNQSLPDGSGTLALPTISQTWTAPQSFSNGTELRFFSTNGTNYAGFKGGASTSNLIWLFPSTDSSGTQCLSSNGAFQLAWSACSAGTGTPGGSNGAVQYNNSSSFGGANGFTFDGTSAITLGVAGTSLGKITLNGNTSGNVVLQPNAAAGSVTLTLPNVAGTLASSGTAPIAVTASTGVITCTTCTTNASSLTSNQLVLGGGGNAVSVLGAGTTTTILHGGTPPSFSAVNLGTDISGTLPIANGGTGQITAAAAFNSLSPITSTGDLIIGNGTNSATRLAIGTNGLCLVSNGTTATWNSCAAGSVSGSATSGQGTFWSASTGIAGSPNWLYSASSGHSVIQGANNTDALFMKRFTDSAPTGNFLHFQTATSADIFKLDVLGNMTTSSLTISGTCNGGTAGCVILTNGTPPSATASAVTLFSPVSVTGYIFSFPNAATSGFLRGTAAGSVETGTFVAASGVGPCTNQVVTATNDNAVPTCSNVIPAMFSSQVANTFLGANNGSASVPTFRILASGDIPPINLASVGTNGGVTGTCTIASGCTGQTTALAAFNALSPMTTAGDIIYGGSAGSGTRLAAGSATQVLHSGTTPSWSAVSLTSDVTGVTPLANGGTNASSGLANTNGFVYSDGTKLVSTATGGAGTLCAISVSGGTPSWGSCAGSASTVWSSLTAASADLSLSQGTFNTLFTHGVMTGTRNIFELTDGASTSTGSMWNIHSNASSTMKPITITAQGTANGVQMSTAGLLASIGTGVIKADQLNLNVNTTSPLGGGGTLTAAITLTCTTCVTSGGALTNNGVIVGSGSGQGTASIGAGTAGQILRSAGTGSAPAMSDLYDVKFIPAANCNNTTSGSAWSIGSGGTVTCRAGTNNLGGYIAITDTSTTFATFQIAIPEDWDTGVNPYIRFQIASADATNGHTIIPNIQVACYKGDGSTTDDVAANAAHSLSTTTLNGNANRFWSGSNVQMNSTDVTGCVAGALMQVTVGRATDTATDAKFYGATITFPRLMTAQAN